MITKLKKKILYTKLFAVVINVVYLFEGIALIKDIANEPVLIYSTAFFFIGLVIYSIAVIANYPNSEKEINKPITTLKQLFFLLVLFIPSFLWGFLLYGLSMIPSP